MRRWLGQHRLAVVLLALVALVSVGRAFMAWPSEPVGSESMRWTMDTDTWLRLELVRHWLEGGGWYDHEMSRSNAPYGGTQSPWTRPLDVVIAAVAGLMQGDVTTRLIKAAIVLPVLWAVLFSAGLMVAARRLLPHPDSTVVVFAVAVCTPLTWSYFGVANADHHAPLAVCAVWLLALLFRARAVDYAWAGLLLSLMLWMSPEALLLLGLVLVAGAVRFVATGEGVREHVLLTLALAVGVALAVMAERAPAAWLLPLYDSVSVVHVVAMALVAAALLALRAVPQRWLRHVWQRAGWGVLLSLGAGGVLYSIYPDFFRGPMVGLHPYIYEVFLPRINEAQPLWRQANGWMMLSVLWQPACALLALWLLWRRGAAALVGGRKLVLLAVMLLGLLAACMQQLRWFYYLAPVMALMLTLVLAPLFNPQHEAVRAHWPARVLVGEAAGFQVWLRQMALLVVLVVPLLLAVMAPSGKADATQQALSDAEQDCETLATAWLRTGGLVRDVGAEPKTILAPTDLGTQILYFSAHRIIASNYHREGAAIAYVWEAVKVTDVAEFRAYLAKRAVDVLMLCPAADAPAGSVWMGLYAGSRPVPAWLAPMRAPDVPAWSMLPAEEYAPKLFRVVR